MRKNLTVYDNFLSNPKECRMVALNASYDKYGNYPGLRADVDPVYREVLKERFQSILDVRLKSFETFYQYARATDRSWIHADYEEFAAVLYLTPNAPISAGTGHYCHRPTGISSRLGVDQKILSILDSEAQDLTKWDRVAEVGNVFNRLILYPGDLYHMSMDYFGKGLEDGRLFQVFFMNTDA